MSKTQLEGIVKKAASDWSAEGELLNLLMRKIPESLEELQFLNKKEDMLLRPKMQYRIWTGDVCKEVEDINEYESKKNSFDFFIDLDEKIHQSLKKSGADLSPLSVKLLICLVERLDKRASLEKLLKDVWDEEVQENVDFKKLQQSKIEQQLTKLENFCGSGFRKHLFSEKFENGIGLKMSFKNQYFIFKRLG